MRLNEISPAARKCVRWMRAHSGIPNLNSITLYYRFTEDFEAFDRAVRAEREKIYPPNGRRRSVFESKKE